MRLKSVLLAACAVAWQNTAPAAEGPYKFLNEIAIGGEGGWDILTVDSPAHRLYLSHATKVVVVDLEKNAVAGEIPTRRACTDLCPYRNCNAVFPLTARRRKQAWWISRR